MTTSQTHSTTTFRDLRRPVRPQVAAALLACALGPWAVALAQTQATTAPASAGTGMTGEARARQAAHLDAGFMKQAAENNHAEVESGKLAAQKATDAKVKAFAQKMVEDHTAKGQELAALASAKGIELPEGPSMMQKGKLKLLSTSKGENFDRRYAQTMGVAAHEDTIALFRKAAADAHDAEVKAFATKTLPALEHHLQMARELPLVEKEKKESRSR